MQFVGRLMRDVDPEPFRAALEQRAGVSRAARALFAAAARWRHRLLSEAGAAGEFVAAHPDVDAAALAELVREARAERASGRPPHKFRALFRLVAQSVAP